VSLLFAAAGRHHAAAPLCPGRATVVAPGAVVAAV